MTRPFDLLARCLRGILARPGRAALTAFGIGVGAAAALQLLDATHTGTANPGRRPGAPARIPRLMVSNGERQSLASVWATTPERARRAGLVAVEGRSLAALDLRDGRRVAVIGAGLRAELFGFRSALLQPIEIGDARFTVVGVFAAQGALADGAAAIDADRTIVLPESSAPAHVAGQTASLQAGPPDRGSARGSERLGPVAMLAPVAALALLLGGVALACAMLASVVERSREIALRRIVGATRGEVFAECVLESILVGSLGGLVGVAAALAPEPGTAAGIPLWGAPAVLGLAAMVGAAAGVVPACRAARLDPIEVLRAE